MQRPQDVGPAGLEAWSEAIDTLRTMGEDPERSAGAIARYARAVDDAEFVRRRWITAKRPTKAAGSKGQAMPHPFLRAIQDAEDAASRAADRLGLSPAARRAVNRPLGRPQGSSQAPDRRPGLRKAA